MAALAIWFKPDIAQVLASVVIITGHTDSRDLQAVAAAFGIPWRNVMAIYWEQTGQVVEVER